MIFVVVHVVLLQHRRVMINKYPPTFIIRYDLLLVFFRLLGVT